MISNAAVFFFAASTLPIYAAALSGVVSDPSGSPIPAAQVTLLNRVGVVVETRTNAWGAFELRYSEAPGLRLMIAAPGFATRALEVRDSGPLEVKLEIAPQSDAIRVVGSAVDVPLSEQGNSVAIVGRAEIEERNEAVVSDLLRYLPGVVITQNGARGAVTGAYIRGGNTNYNLVQVDGVPLNSFGGGFDLAHLPADWLDRIEVLRGPQSALYGSYANSGVINLVPRGSEEGANLDVLAEGGSYTHRRFAVSGSALVRGFDLAGAASKLDTDGPQVNSDYRLENVYLRLARTGRRQGFSAHGSATANENGVAGAWGSNPLGLFGGLDRVSRNANTMTEYLGRYFADLRPNLRQEFFASYFQNNSGYLSPFGFSINKDVRGRAETRTTVAAGSWYTAAIGGAWAREQVRNTFITDAGNDQFPMRRDHTGVYFDNRFHAGGLFVNAGVRGDFIHTLTVPGNAFSRPVFPEKTVTKWNPRVSAAWMLRGTRLHAAVATGIRPPTGFELAFTNNPGLRPEHTTSFEAGVERSLFRNRAAVDATWFHNRFRDQIVSLLGTLAQLGRYQTDNLSNSAARGVELSARVRPMRSVSVAGNYTWLKTEILALDGSNLAPQFFRVGQRLLRRPEHSGALTSSFHWRRVTTNVTGAFRGSVLDVEPNRGASRGFFENSGFANLGINVNVYAGRGVTVYGHLRNALNQRYEEAFGFPALRLNFVTGLKWSLSRAR